jgi:hypothetical protein
MPPVKASPLKRECTIEDLDKEKEESVIPAFGISRMPEVRPRDAEQLITRSTDERSLPPIPSTNSYVLERGRSPQTVCRHQTACRTRAKGIRRFLSSRRKKRTTCPSPRGAKGRGDRPGNAVRVDPRPSVRACLITLDSCVTVAEVGRSLAASRSSPDAPRRSYGSLGQARRQFRVQMPISAQSSSQSGLK